MYEVTTVLKMCTGCKILWTRSKSSDKSQRSAHRKYIKAMLTS